MDLTIELTPEEEVRLRELAADRGVPPEEVVTQAIKKLLPRTGPDQENLDIVDLIQRWREEDATDDPEELERRDMEWDELKANLNANREATGEGLLFP